MDRTNSLKYFTLVCSGLIVAVWTVYLMADPTKYALAVVLFLITFFTGQLLLGQNKTQKNVRDGNLLLYRVRQYSGDIIAISLAFSSLLVVAIPPIEGELYVVWGELPPLNVIRLVVAFSLNFLPGYVILNIFDRKAIFHGVSKFVSSYLLSLFLMTITGFLCARVYGVIDSLYLMAFIAINMTLVAIYFTLRLHKIHLLTHTSVNSSTKNITHRLPILLVVLSLTFQCVWVFGSLNKVNFFIGGPGSDQWRIHGFAQSFLDGRAFSWLHVIWWFHVYLASFTMVSGAPSVNAYVSLYPLIVMSKLAFYVMVSSFFRERRIASLATLAYTLFSGPAWFYAIHLRAYGPMTDYGSWINILWQTGGRFLYEGWYPPFNIGFVASDVAYTCLWWLMYSVCHLDLKRRFNFILTSIVFVLSYLLHGVEPLIFALYVTALSFVYLFFKNEKWRMRIRMAALSIVVGLVIVTIIELSLSDHYLFSRYPRDITYSFPKYYYFNTLHFYGIGVIAGILFALSYITPNITALKSSYQSKIKKLRFMFPVKRIKKLSIIAIFCLYAVSLIIWIRGLDTFDSGNIGTGPIPWYAYPATGGIPFLLGLIGIAYLILKWNKVKRNVKNMLAFSVVSIFLLFVFGRSVSMLNLYFFYTGFWERRVLPYMHAMISILMAFALFAIIRQKRLVYSWRRFALVSSLISIIVLSSVSTALIALDFTTRSEVSAPSLEELEALTYLHYSIPAGSKIGYLNMRTGTYYIRCFANDKWGYDVRSWFGGYSYSPSLILNYIGRNNVQYLYLHHTRDNETLQKNLLIQQILRILPIAFENSEVTIYEIPPLHPPQMYSNLGLMPYNSTVDASYNAYVLWLITFAVSNYSFKLTQANFETSQVLVLPFDPPKYEKTVAELWEWVRNGGQLFVSNTNPYGVFSDFLGVQSRLNLTSCDSTENWGTLHERGEISICNSTKIDDTSCLNMTNTEKIEPYNGSWEEWVYAIPDHWDLNGYEYLGLYVYNAGTFENPMGPQWYLHLYDSNGNRSFPSYRYDLSRRISEGEFEPTFNGWQLHLIPIKEYFGNVDLSKISELRIVTGFQLPVEMLIDDIFALKTPSSVTADSISGKIVVDLPLLNIPDVRLGTDVIPVANYTLNGITVTPFAIQKNFGAGTITYVNINSVYEFVLFESSEVLFPDKLVEILECLNIEMQPYD